MMSHNFTFFFGIDTFERSLRRLLNKFLMNNVINVCKTGFLVQMFLHLGISLVESSLMFVNKDNSTVDGTLGPDKHPEATTRSLYFQYLISRIQN